MANTQYTEKQLKIISGEIPLDTIDGYAAVWLYKKAVANGDTELATKALERKGQAKEEARKRNVERAIKNHTLRKKEIFQWKQPKSKDYTKHHKQIIRGEIPFDKVHTNELIAIYQKARNNKDDVLADLVFDEISERRRKANQKEKANKKRKNKLRQFFDGFDDYDPNIPLSRFRQALLKGAVDIFECPEEEIITLIEQLAELNDEKNLKIAHQLLSYKQDISILYPTKDHWEAIDKIEELLQLPIRRPKDWF